jgi:tetratricopeptide (TPR) repeat protein
MTIIRPRIIRSPLETGTDGVGKTSNRRDSPFQVAEFLRMYRRPGWLDRPSWERISGCLGLIAAEVLNTPAADNVAQLYYEAARLLESELNDDEGAVKALQAAYASDPEYRPIIRMARRVFARIDRWSMVCTFVEAWARSAQSEEERSLALLELGEILLLRFGKVDDAARCIERAAEQLQTCPYASLLHETVRSLMPEPSALTGAVTDGS